MFNTNGARLYVLVTIIFLTSWLISLSAQFADGNGTQQDPWQIATANHLNNIRNYLGEENNDKYFIQTANIDLGIAPWNRNEGWRPTGSSEINSMQGYFNGNGFTINGLTILRPNNNNQGLFGYTYGATLTNIILINVSIEANDDVGALVGYSSLSTISKCFSSGNIRGTNNIGGLIGTVKDTNAFKNYSASRITATRNNIGGLIGQNIYSTISNSYSIGNVNGDVNIGGLVGINYFSTINNCYSTGLVTGTGFLGGLVGKSTEGVTNYSYWNIETSGRNQSKGGEGRTTNQMTHPYSVDTYEDWDFYTIWAVDSDYTINNGYPYINFQLDPTSVEDFGIMQNNPLLISNYPNPFNPLTTIRFTIAHQCEVQLDVYNFRGQLVNTIYNGYSNPGTHSYSWDGKDSSGRALASGIYLVKLKAGNEIFTHRLIMAK